MKRLLRYGWLGTSLCVGLLAFGCASLSSFYKVTDLQSGKEYYTQKVDHLASGAVVVNDTRTDSIITLQNSQVKKVSEKEYKDGLAAPGTITAPAAPPAAVPAPVAAPSSAPSGTK